MYLLLTATHSLRSSPSGSSTANLRLPEPRVAAACFIRSYWCVPSGIFFLGLNVFDDLPPLEKETNKTGIWPLIISVWCVGCQHSTTLTIGSSLWICLEHKPNVSWQTIAMNILSQQYVHLPTNSAVYTVYWYGVWTKRPKTKDWNRNITTTRIVERNKRKYSTPRSRYSFANSICNMH